MSYLIHYVPFQTQAFFYPYTYTVVGHIQQNTPLDHRCQEEFWHKEWFETFVEPLILIPLYVVSWEGHEESSTLGQKQQHKWVEHYILTQKLKVLVLKYVVWLTHLCSCSWLNINDLSDHSYDPTIMTTKIINKPNMIYVSIT
jgi:hypothetical protein